MPSPGLPVLQNNHLREADTAPDFCDKRLKSLLGKSCLRRRIRSWKHISYTVLAARVWSQGCTQGRGGFSLSALLHTVGPEHRTSSKSKHRARHSAASCSRFHCGGCARRPQVMHSKKDAPAESGAQVRGLPTSCLSRLFSAPMRLAPGWGISMQLNSD